MTPPARATPADDRPGRRLLLASLATLAAIGAAAPWIARSAIAVLSVDATTPIEWVPATFPPRLAYDRFTAEFESGDVVVASWPGCTLGSPAIDRFLAVATGSAAPRDADGQPWFEGIATGQTALAR